jgi:Flp pilus assembly pilin Flp
MGVFSQMRKNEKGQGIIEYALLLAFIAGLAMFLHTGGLTGFI